MYWMETYDIITRHVGSVVDISVSPDNRYIASLGADRYLVVHSFMDKRTFSFIVDPNIAPTCMCWSPDSKYVAIGMGDSRIDIWDITHGKIISQMLGHQQSVSCLAWGKYLASGSKDKTIRIWDHSSGDCITILRGHTSDVLSLDWLADSDYLVSCGADMRVILWDVSYGRQIATFSGHLGVVISAIFVDDKTIISCGKDGLIRFWNIKTRKSTKVLRLDCEPECVSCEPNTMRIAIGCSDGKILLLENEKKVSIDAHKGKVTALSWSTDGRVLVSGGEYGEVKLWKLD